MKKEVIVYVDPLGGGRHVIEIDVAEPDEMVISTELSTADNQPPVENPISE